MSKSYKVWLLDEFEQCNDEDERDDLAWSPRVSQWQYAPNSPQHAAELYADYCHARRNGCEWTWPVDFVVTDGEQFWKLEVSREAVPEFTVSSRSTYQPKKLNEDAP